MPAATAQAGERVCALRLARLDTVQTSTVWIQCWRWGSDWKEGAQEMWVARQRYRVTENITAKRLHAAVDDVRVVWRARQ